MYKSIRTLNQFTFSIYLLYKKKRSFATPLCVFYQARHQFFTWKLETRRRKNSPSAPTILERDCKLIIGSYYSKDILFQLGKFLDKHLFLTDANDTLYTSLTSFKVLKDLSSTKYLY